LAVQDDVYRRMGGAARVAILFRWSTMAREIAAAGNRQRHPEYHDEQTRLALARLVFGETLVREAWPDRALVDP
jgi:hypothetical protein